LKYYVVDCVAKAKEIQRKEEQKGTIKEWKNKKQKRYKCRNNGSELLSRTHKSLFLPLHRSVKSYTSLITRGKASLLN
jgi:hypothetical protein